MRRRCRAVERAIDGLFTVLRTRAETITGHDEVLRAVLEALDMAAERIDAVVQR